MDFQAMVQQSIRLAQLVALASQCQQGIPWGWLRDNLSADQQLRALVANATSPNPAVRRAWEHVAPHWGYAWRRHA